MTVPNIDDLTTAELAELVDRAMILQNARRGTARGNLSGAAAALDRLIGPDNPTAPSMTSLTEVQLYTDAQIAANVPLAVRLSFKATEQSARILRDVLTIIR